MFKFTKPKLPKLPKFSVKVKPPKIKPPKPKTGIINFIKKTYVYIISGIIFVGLAVANFISGSNLMLALSGIIIAVMVIIVINTIKKGGNKKTAKKLSGTKAKELVLVDEDGNELKIWSLEGMPAMLIGKKDSANEVDVDLGNTVYANLISREHAVMNFDGYNWYVEDAGSLNGTGIRSLETGKTIKLLDGTRFPVFTGDVISIANTTLLLR